MGGPVKTARWISHESKEGKRKSSDKKKSLK